MSILFVTANPPAPVLTIGEAEDVLRRSGTPVSARRLRLFADRGLAPAIAAACETATGIRANDTPNGARMFTAPQLVLMWLIDRMRKDGVPDRASWALIGYHGGDLLDACAAESDTVVWMEATGVGHLLTAADAADKPRRECYRLGPMAARIYSAIAAVRRGKSEAWNGHRLVSVDELAGGM